MAIATVASERSDWGPGCRGGRGPSLLKRGFCPCSAPALYLRGFHTEIFAANFWRVSLFGENL